jgi:hypothetical protein
MFEETSRRSDGLIELFGESTAEIDVGHSGAQTENTGPHKILLPRGSAETRFAPRQYYYVASRSGAVPSWAVKAPNEGRSQESLASSFPRRVAPRAVQSKERRLGS